MSNEIREAIAAIEYALGPGSSRMFRSTWGEMLERAMNNAYSSTGKKHHRPTGNELKIKHQWVEPSYEMQVEDARIAWAVTLLAEVGRTSGRLKEALRLYHGDSGARWGRTATREQALFVMTKRGQTIVRQARLKFHTSADIRDDELIAQDLANQQLQPNDIRRMHHLAMAREADDLRSAAWEALAHAVAMHPRLPNRWAQ